MLITAGTTARHQQLWLHAQPVVSAHSLAAAAGAGLTLGDLGLLHFRTVVTMSGYLGDLERNTLSTCHDLTSGTATGARAEQLERVLVQLPWRWERTPFGEVLLREVIRRRSARGDREHARRRRNGLAVWWRPLVVFSPKFLCCG